MLLCFIGRTVLAYSQRLVSLLLNRLNDRVAKLFERLETILIAEYYGSETILGGAVTITHIISTHDILVCFCNFD